MRRSWLTVLIGSVALLVAGLACTDTATQPDPIQFAGADASLEMLSAKGVVASVTGNGHFLGLPRDRTTTFDIRQYADGTVKGWYKVEGRGPGGAHVFVAFDCLHVVGNEAWASGVYVRASNPDNIGRGYTLRVVDNGEGAKAMPDLIGGDRFNAHDCTTEPDLPMRELVMGNLQVRGGVDD